jgi:hypothetical protein
VIARWHADVRRTVVEWWHALRDASAERRMRRVQLRRLERIFR